MEVFTVTEVRLGELAYVRKIRRFTRRELTTKCNGVDQLLTSLTRSRRDA